MDAYRLSSFERKTAALLAAVFASRMLGLFMVLPIFAIYAQHLIGYSPAAVGLAIGIYGLTQALLQVPLGALSDRIGRKPIIVGGLVVFALGGIVAALADSMLGVTIGRALQGAGAISSAVLALAADVTRVELRSKVMALIGASIGVTFALSMVLGPVVAQLGGLSGVFWLTSGFAILGILAVRQVRLEDEQGVNQTPKTAPIGFGVGLKSILRDRELLRCDAGIFILHGLLMGAFVTIPVVLTSAGLPAAKHGYVYLGVFFISFLLMWPAMRFAAQYQWHKPFFLAAIGLLGVGLLTVAFFVEQVVGVLAGLTLFFVGFNYLEASLPSTVSRFAAQQTRGAALGLYATMQFLGAFIGGAVSGYLHEYASVQIVFITCSSLALAWLLLAMGMMAPAEAEQYVINTQTLSDAEFGALTMRLKQLVGVRQLMPLKGSDTLLIRVDKRLFDETAIAEYLN